MSTVTDAPTRDAIDAEHREFEHDNPATAPEGGAPPIEDLRVDGTTQLGLFDAGGKRPTSASMKLAGGKIALVDGRAFKKGDTIRLEITAVVNDVGQKDTADKATGQVVSCEQRHVARIVDLRVID